MRTEEVIVSFGAALFLLAIRSFSQSPLRRQQQIESHMRQAQVYLSENEPDLAATRRLAGRKASEGVR
jgi:hypothetical protein